MRTLPTATLSIPITHHVLWYTPFADHSSDDLPSSSGPPPQAWSPLDSVPHVINAHESDIQLQNHLAQDELTP